LREVRRYTDDFLLVNDGHWGTTCAADGCMPSKALIEAANVFHRRHDFDEFGIRGAEGLRADIPVVLARVRKMRDSFREGAGGGGTYGRQIARLSRSISGAAPFASETIPRIVSVRGSPPGLGSTLAGPVCGGQRRGKSLALNILSGFAPLGARFAGTHLTLPLLFLTPCPPKLAQPSSPGVIHFRRLPLGGG